MELSVNPKKIFALNIISFLFIYNTSLGKFGSKIIDGILLIKDLRYAK